MPKIIQSVVFLSTFFGKFAGPLMKVAVPLAKTVLASLATMESVSAIDAAIHIKMPGGGFLWVGKKWN